MSETAKHPSDEDLSLGAPYVSDDSADGGLRGMLSHPCAMGPRKNGAPAVVVELTKGKRKNNRRSFDSPATRCVTGFAQDDTVCGRAHGFAWERANMVLCLCSREDFSCKKNEANQGESVEDHLAHDVDGWPAGNTEIRSGHAEKRRARSCCEAVSLAPGWTG